MHKYHLFKAEYEKDSIEVLNLLGLIPLKYNGEMKIFDDMIDEIIRMYPFYKKFLKDYFIENKKFYLENNFYNYSLLPVDCRSNSSLETYNKYLKENLGKKNALTWWNFINFIINDNEKNKNRLYEKSNFNILYESKFTKFSLYKYSINEKKINNKLYYLNNNLNPFLTNIKWIKYKNFSCRYDSFLTLTIYGYYFPVKNNNYIHLNFITKKCEDIILNKNFDILGEIQHYYIINHLNVLKTKIINNSKIVEDDWFHKFGYVNQLFSIFENISLFCVEYKKESKCKYCSFNASKLNYYNNLKHINKVNLNNLESSFLFKLQGIKNELCTNCNIRINSLETIYIITSFPKFLFFIFDYNSYNLLLNDKANIIKKQNYIYNLRIMRNMI